MSRFHRGGAVTASSWWCSPRLIVVVQSPPHRGGAVTAPAPRSGPKWRDKFAEEPTIWLLPIIKLIIG